MHLADAPHGEEDREGEPEGGDEHARSDEADEARMAMPLHRMMVVAVRAACLIVRGHRVCLAAVIRSRIVRSETERARQREQAVQHEAEQRQERQEPDVARDRSLERVRARRRGMLEEHQPFRRLMFDRSTVCRCRKSAMMIASPTAASAAATVMTKNDEDLAGDAVHAARTRRRSGSRR